MSYAIVGAGAFPAFGIAASGCTADCTGGERDADGDCCCSDSDWSNATYKDIKGVKSLRYHNEKRIRHALSLLLPAGITDFAYDLQVPDNTTLQRGIDRAARNFYALNPPSRWTKHKCEKPSPTGCQDCYSVWRMKGPTTSDEEQAAALRNMGASDEEIVRYLEMRTGISIGVVGLTAAQRELIKGVPGGYWSTPRRTMPAIEHLLEVKGGKVEPKEWLKRFLDFYAPGWAGIRVSRGSGLLQRVAVAAPKPPIPAVRATRRVAKVEHVVEEEDPVADVGEGESYQPQGDEENGETNWLLIGGIGILAVGAIGAGWYLTR